MLVLALDTATTRITAGVVALDAGAGPPRTLAARDLAGSRAHAELLAPAIRDVLAETGHDRRDLDAVVCGLGPGPFTGLRVGLVTAAALGDALDRPVHGVPTHDALAAGWPGTVVVVTDARRREVYTSRFVDGVRLHGPEVGPPTPLTDGTDHLLGDAAPLVGGTADVPGPTPAGLVAVAASALRAGATPGPLVPLYLRRPDAVPPGAPKTVTRLPASGAGPSTA